MGFLDNIGGGVSGILQTPEGKDMVKKFLASPDGQNMIINYISTPQGKQFLGNLLMGIVDKMNISPEQKEMVRKIAQSQIQESSGQQQASQEQSSDPAPDVQ
jgi:hypothetical protein